MSRPVELVAMMTATAVGAILALVAVDATLWLAMPAVIVVGAVTGLARRDR